MPGRRPGASRPGPVRSSSVRSSRDGPLGAGQHDLRADVARRIVAAAPIAAGDLVLDLGAGHGALTLPLAEASCRVVAVELDAGRARHLERLSRTAGLDVRVVHGDLHRVPLPRRPFAVVANPPFRGTWDLLRRLLGASVPLRAGLEVHGAGGNLDPSSERGLTDDRRRPPADGRGVPLPLPAVMATVMARRRP